MIHPFHHRTSLSLPVLLASACMRWHLAHQRFSVLKMMCILADQSPEQWLIHQESCSLHNIFQQWWSEVALQTFLRGSAGCNKTFLTTQVFDSQHCFASRNFWTKESGFWLENPSCPCKLCEIISKPLLRRALCAGSPGPSVCEAYVKLAKPPSELHIAYSLLINQLASGHCALKYHLFKICKIFNPLCPNCGAKETVFNFMNFCPKYRHSRVALRRHLRSFESVSGQPDLTWFLASERLRRHCQDFSKTQSASPNIFSNETSSLSFQTPTRNPLWCSFFPSFLFFF